MDSERPRVEYINGDSLREDWIENIDKDFRDRLILDKDLFVCLLITELENTAKKLNKSVKDVSVTDIMNSLYDKSSLKNTVSVTRYKDK